MDTIPEYSYTTCDGTAIGIHKEVLAQIGPSMKQVNLTPSYDSATNSEKIDQNKIITMLSQGYKVIIGGNFTPKSGGDPVEHFSLIVGYENGEFVYNDTYFNCDDHINPSHKVCSDNLDDYLNISITEAVAVKP
jgi:hypothetical protein